MNNPKNGSAEKKASRKLKLNRTTVKQLSEQHLAEAAGGTDPFTILCDELQPSHGAKCYLSVPKHVC